jgi:hypothetical protein
LAVTSWYLLCIDCATTVNVGQVVLGPNESDGRLAGFRDWPSGDWIEKESLWSVVEHFLLLHRGHELGLVPYHFLESVDEAADVIERPLITASDFLASRVPPFPVGYDQVSDRLHMSVRERQGDKS